MDTSAGQVRRGVVRWSTEAVEAREQAREEERRRLARELHDDLGQALLGLKMDLAWLEQRFRRPRRATADAHAKLQMMVQVVDQCIHTLRSVITELRPQALDQLGLIPAMEWQTEMFARRFGVRARFVSAVEQLEIDMGRATAVFRMFQEMLTNVARHARASLVSVLVRVERNTLVVTVRDNGRGVDPERAVAPSAIGLLGMRERSALLGGDLQIVSRPRRGTTIAVRIPLENRRRALRPVSLRNRT